MEGTIMPASPCLFLFFLFAHFATLLAQSPLPAPGPVSLPPPSPALVASAAAPGPAGPTNITAILEKAGHFTTLIRLLKSTQTADRINTQLSTTNSGLTIFAPGDAAFASLKQGTLNSYTDQQKAELVQFHMLPTYLSMLQFQTASNPISTEAGGTNYGEFPLNITSAGAGVNMTSGFSNATILNTVYIDGQLAVYEVDKVLLPQRFFIDPPPPPPLSAPAPAPAKEKKRAPVVSSVSSHAAGLNILMHEKLHACFLVAAVAAGTWWLF